MRLGANDVVLRTNDVALRANDVLPSAKMMWATPNIIVFRRYIINPPIDSLPFICYTEIAKSKGVHFMKQVFLAFISMIILLSCVACGNNNAEPKENTFTHDSGFSITLNDSFKEENYNNYTVSYNSADITVFVLKEEFSLMEGFGDYTVLEYAEMVRESNSKHSPTKIMEDNSLVSFEYGYFNKEENIAYKYFTTLFKGDDAFWLVQFACTADEYETLRPQMIQYAKTVNVNQ